MFVTVADARGQSAGGGPAGKGPRDSEERLFIPTPLGIIE